jgi:hypothetical protein
MPGATMRPVASAQDNDGNVFAVLTQQKEAAGAAD